MTVTKKRRSSKRRVLRNSAAICPATGGEHVVNPHDLTVPYGGPHDFYVEIACRKCGAEARIPVDPDNAEWES
jgi:RNase P subunit RPR2